MIRDTLLKCEALFFPALSSTVSGAVEACKKPCEVEKTSRNKCDTRCYSAIFLIIIMIDPCSAQGDMTMTSILQRLSKAD